VLTVGLRTANDNTNDYFLSIASDNRAVVRWQRGRWLPCEHVGGAHWRVLGACTDKTPVALGALVQAIFEWLEDHNTSPVCNSEIHQPLCCGVGRGAWPRNACRTQVWHLRVVSSYDR
jgi:hypothetical protein